MIKSLALKLRSLSSMIESTNPPRIVDEEDLKKLYNLF